MVKQYSKAVKEYIREHKLDALFPFEDCMPKYNIRDCVESSYTEPYPLHWHHLVYLHKVIRRRKVATILEFGVGYSTVLMAHALWQNKQEYAELFAQNIRCGNLFEVHSVDNSAEYIQQTKDKLRSDLNNIVCFSFSEVDMGTFQDRICTYYRNLPNISPQLIFLDGPHQFGVRGSIRGITTEQEDRLPMSADILALEYCLLPGTLLVVDGRTANVRFLQGHLRRNWQYRYEADLDFHVFELKEKPLGAINRRQIELMLGKSWLASV